MFLLSPEKLSYIFSLHLIFFKPLPCPLSSVMVLNFAQAPSFSSENLLFVFHFILLDSFIYFLHM